MQGIQEAISDGEAVADILVICVGRVGTNSITSALQDHPGIAHVFANSAWRTKIRDEREQNPSPAWGSSGIMFKISRGPKVFQS